MQQEESAYEITLSTSPLLYKDDKKTATSLQMFFARFRAIVSVVVFSDSNAMKKVS